MNVSNVINTLKKPVPPLWYLLVIVLVTVLAVSNSHADDFLSFNSGESELAQTELDCMAEAMYHEGAIDGRTGMYLVGEVIMNRSSDTTYKFKTLTGACAVAHQPSRNDNYWECAFSYYCDGKSEDVFDTKQNREAFELAYELAYALLNNKTELDLTDGALYYTQVDIYRGWMDNTVVTITYLNHTFRKRMDQEPKQKPVPVAVEEERVPITLPLDYFFQPELFKMERTHD